MPDTLRDARPGREFEHLCVDDFLGSLIDARAIATALEIGLIDALLAAGAATRGALESRLSIRPRGFGVLLDLLRRNGVLTERDGAIRLTAPFRSALRYRDLLEVRIAFADAVLSDVSGLFTQLLCDPAQFMARSRVFDLFRYDRCSEPSAQNMRMTREWMRFTTCLTKYESRVCLKYHDFGAHEHILDVGGNSGEFMLRVCKRYPGVRATVFDLPVVCAIGKEHLDREQEAQRIRFVRGDARVDPLPRGHDLICFKSFLHDWPEADARRFLRRAAQALPDGGTLFIFERGPLEITHDFPYSMIPNLLFLHFFRPPGAYVEQLEALGFDCVEVKRIELEMPFHLIRATKPG